MASTLSDQRLRSLPAGPHSLAPACGAAANRPAPTCRWPPPIAGKTTTHTVLPRPEMSQFCNPVKSARPRSLSLSPYALVLPYRSATRNVRRQQEPHTPPRSAYSYRPDNPMQELAFGLAKESVWKGSLLSILPTIVLEWRSTISSAPDFQCPMTARFPALLQYL